MSISIAGLAVGPGVGVRVAVAGSGVAAVTVAGEREQILLQKTMGLW